MVMKIVLVVAMVMMLGQGMAAGRCSRSQKKYVSNLRTKLECKEPHDTLVQLEVPEGFDFVSPNAVVVKRCDGLFCNIQREKCSPKSGFITTKTFIVEIFKGTSSYCKKIGVEQHEACECGCEETPCGANKIFSEDKCECVCDSAKEAACNRKRQNGISVMWSSDWCLCVCDNEESCAYNHYWSSDWCRCMLHIQNNDSNEI